MDCMEGMAKYPDKYFDLAIVDPPYGIGASKRKSTIKDGKHLCGFLDDTRYKLSDWDLNRPNKEYFIELQRISKNQIIWGGNYFTDLLPISRGWVFWDKKPNVPNYSDGELAWTSFDMVLKRIIIMWNGKIRTGIEKGYFCIHPTQKPIKLYKWLLTNYANQGDKILDTHLGSGSSRIAAYDMGFDFVGFELDKDYFDAQEKRFNEFKQQLKLF
jgi:site-specific DNA-methyltransferase (adenine-specific)